MEDVNSSACNMRRITRSMTKSGRDLQAVVVNRDYQVISRKPNIRRKTPVSIPYLPEEIVFKIFVCLPATFVHLMRLVCRTWYKLIRDPVFTKAYLLQSSHYSPFGAVVSDDYFQLLDCINKHGTTYLEPTKRINRRCLAHGNGLILSADSDDCWVLYLINPLTKQIITLPNPPVVNTDFSVNWAVAYTPSTSKYKVVCTEYSSKKAYILTVGVDKEWRKIVAEPDIMTEICYYTYPEGICGFISFDHRQDKYIVVLDLEEEIFYKVDFLKETEGIRSYYRLKTDKILCIAIKKKNECWNFWELVNHKNGGEWRKLGVLDIGSNSSVIDKNSPIRGDSMLLMSRDEVIFRCYCCKFPFICNFKSGMVSRSFDVYVGDSLGMDMDFMVTNSLVVL